MRSNVSMIILLILVMLATSGISLAQRTTATFAGIVTDPSGAVLPGAEVEMLNEGTSGRMQQITSETGEFLFNFVPVGTYTLKITLPGFKTYESPGIPLGAAQNVRRTYTLEIGNITDNVTVSAEAPREHHRPGAAVQSGDAGGEQPADDQPKYHEHSEHRIGADQGRGHRQWLRWESFPAERPRRYGDERHRGWHGRQRPPGRGIVERVRQL